MTAAVGPESPLGDLLQALVNRVSHRGGRTLALMNQASVTLQQVLLLSRVAEATGSTASQLAGALNMSLPSISQMIDRLHQLKLVTRVEMEEDRRKKRIALTRAGRAFLERLQAARSAEYQAGLATLPQPLRAELEAILARTLRALTAQD